MPDPILIVTAMSVAFGVSGALSAIIGWPWRRAQTTLYDTGWILGIGIGFCAGCWVLDIRPHWPPRQDLDRLLVVVVPAAIAVELLAILPQAPRWLVWPGRLVVIAGTARVLLHGTSYLNDLTGPGTSEWSPSLALLILGGLALLEGTVWALLSLLARRAKDPSLSICLVVASAGAAVTVMLSGYATGGQIGLPLAAALAGATVALLFETRAGRGIGPLGLPLVVFFSLFLLGRFFGALSSVHALLLLCAPLLGWLLELPYLRQLPSWVRGSARVVLVGAVVLIIVVRAQTKFDHDFANSGASGAKEPSIQDYLDFGK